MRASVRHAYGDPDLLRVEEVPTPSPRPDEIRVRIRAASVNLGDWELLTGQPPYITFLAGLFGQKPRYELPHPDGARGPKYAILGTDFAGEVDAVGSDVTRFRTGDPVFGESSTFGAFAEYACVRADGPVARKPESLSFDVAAAVPQATFIALQGLDRAKVGEGDQVLINGAGGGAGSFAVQIAKARGALVTGVDGPGKQELMRELGADRVLDYTQEDFAARAERYDAILDLAAYRSVSACRDVLRPGGTYLAAGGSGSVMWKTLLLGPLLSAFGRTNVGFLLADSRAEDLERMIELIATGAVKPSIERRYSLEEAGEAIRSLGEKRSKGKVLVVP